MRQHGNYSQYQDEAGVWDRERLQATLQAKAFAARYLLMNEDILDQAQSSVANLQPGDIETPLTLEQLSPGESFASNFGRRADEKAREAKEAVRQRDEVARRRGSGPGAGGVPPALRALCLMRSFAICPAFVPCVAFDDPD
jgi:hypothetical protein